MAIANEYIDSTHFILKKLGITKAAALAMQAAYAAGITAAAMGIPPVIAQPVVKQVVNEGNKVIAQIAKEAEANISDLFPERPTSP